jgi:nucleoside-diphosphate-sugar epimerase
MQVLLTGATGLIGPYVLERLLEGGDAICVLALPETVEQVPSHDRVRVIAGSLDDREALAEATQGVEIVYHLAGLLPGNEPEDILRVNVQGTENLLQACVSAGVHRFVFISSVAVYSPAPWPFMWPITEHHPLRAHGNDALSRYGRSKVAAEDLILRFHREHGLAYVILRPSVVYGPGQGFVQELVQQILNRPRLALAGAAPLGAMHWIHAGDLAEAIMLAGARPNAANNVLNVAGGEVFTVYDLAAAVWDIMGYPSQRLVRRFQAGLFGHYALRFDISKAQAVLGYTPQVKLRDGLEGVLAGREEGQPLGAPVRRWSSGGFRPNAWWRDPGSMMWSGASGEENSAAGQAEMNRWRARWRR